MRHSVFTVLIVRCNCIAAYPTTPKMFKAVLVDLSGTLHVGDQVIPGAIEACRRLQESQVTVRFLTNTSKTSSKNLLLQLRKIRFGPKEIPEIITTAAVARNLILKHNLRPYCLVESDLIQDDLQGINDEEPHNCVLVGLAPNELCYSRLNQAFRILLQNKDSNHPTLIALHKAQYFRDADGDLSLGPGGFVECLERAACVEAVIVGKPSKDFFLSAIPSDVPPDQVVMIGDDALQDCAGAKRAGLGASILVKTGKYREGDETLYPGQVDVVVDSFVDAVDYILGTQTTSAQTSDKTKA